MARTKGTFPFTGTLEVASTAPLDARLLVKTKADLMLEDTWKNGNSIYLYNHIVVTVEDVEGQFMLTNYDPTTAPTAYQNEANWVRLDTKGLKIIDSLDSTSTTNALSAHQGKVLNDKITRGLADLKQDLGTVYSYKGSVNSYSDLQSVTSPKPGDVYNVVNEQGNVPAGTNYAYTPDGTWDALGGTIDIAALLSWKEID